MQKTFTSLIIAAALGTTAVAHAASARSNEAATKRHLASLLAGSEPRVAELTMFFTGMPKGGDLHHHYSGSLYAERYLEWVDREGYCINKISYRIETNKDVVQTERALAPGARMCLSAREVVADDGLYRELLQRWSSKDFANHGAIQPPPDRQFFETFGYFGPVSSSYADEGLRELKQRALAENVSYIETMFKLAPFAVNGEFDQAVVRAGADDAALTAALQQMSDTLEQDAAFKQSHGQFHVNGHALAVAQHDPGIAK